MVNLPPAIPLEGFIDISDDDEDNSDFEGLYPCFIAEDADVNTALFDGEDWNNFADLLEDDEEDE